VSANNLVADVKNMYYMILFNDINIYVLYITINVIYTIIPKFVN